MNPSINSASMFRTHHLQQFDGKFPTLRLVNFGFMKVTK
jgi:hypothetical protein